ncbi:MAG TPA: hypothetical protein VFW40_14465 [Capsulimonadaceae bacterium]|nr:hypothetical protein [Capsulimonadaceae bacterium]
MFTKSAQEPILNARFQLLDLPIAFDAANQRLYGGGQVIDPVGYVLKGSFNPAQPVPFFINLTPVSMAPDPANDAVYILYTDFSNPDVVVGKFTADTFLPIGSFVVPLHDNSERFTAKAGDLVLWGTNGLAFHNADGFVTVINNRQFPGLKSFRLSAPRIIAGGDSVTGTITLTKPAPTEGITVSLSPTFTAGLPVTMPLSVFFPVGTSKQTFSIIAPSTASSQKINLVASYGVQSIFVPLFIAQSTASPEYPTNMRVVNLFQTQVVADPFNKLVYADTSSGVINEGNTLVQISPSTLAVQPLGFVGSEPNKLALSDDGSFLYTGLDGSGAIGRYDFAIGSLGLEFSLGNEFFSGPRHAEDLLVIPGQPHEVVAATALAQGSPAATGARAFVDGMAQPANFIDVDSLAANPDIPGRVYGYDNEDTSFSFDQMSLNNSGLSEIKEKWNLLSGFGDTIAFDNGKVYSTSGQVIDPENLVLLGTFPNVFFGGLVLPDSQDGFVYFVMPNNIFHTAPIQLSVYDPNTYLPVATYALPNLIGVPSSLGRTGPNHLVVGTNAGEVVFINATPAKLSTAKLSTGTPTGGQSMTVTVGLTNVAPIGGITVSLASRSSALSFPNTLLVTQGNSTATVTVNTNSVTVATTVTIRITYNGTTLLRSFVIQP